MLFKEYLGNPEDSFGDKNNTLEGILVSDTIATTNRKHNLTHN